jgi:putative ABC transport system permease protein
MSAILSLFRYPLRLLLKSPGFTITAIGILGLSIGLSTAIFSLIDAVILKPLPFPNSERLVQVCEPHQNHPFSVFDYPDYVDMVAAQHTFEFLAVKKEVTVDLRTNGEAQLLEADFVPPSLSRITGLGTILGRVFTEKEDIKNGPFVAVLSERCWRSRFQSDPNILGKNIILSDLNFQVIGVVPSQLDEWGPPGVDVYLPVHTIVPFNFLGNGPGDPLEFRDSHWFFCFGRLKAGVSFSQAQADLKTIHDNLLSRYQGVNIGYGLKVFPLLAFLYGVSAYDPITLVLTVLVLGFATLIACLLPAARAIQINPTSVLNE